MVEVMGKNVQMEIEETHNCITRCQNNKNYFFIFAITIRCERWTRYQLEQGIGQNWFQFEIKIKSQA